VASSNHDAATRNLATASRLQSIRRQLVPAFSSKPRIDPLETCSSPVCFIYPCLAPFVFVYALLCFTVTTVVPCHDRSYINPFVKLRFRRSLYFQSSFSNYSTFEYPFMGTACLLCIRKNGFSSPRNNVLYLWLIQVWVRGCDYGH
jgi:hypothetical protein